MIGVLASEAELKWAEEFFELFKTPWEPAVPGRRYRVVLSTNGGTAEIPADLTLVYGSFECPVDQRARVCVTPAVGPIEISWGDASFPVYGPGATFGEAGGSLLRAPRGALDYPVFGARTVRRIGYDLFGEIAHLLTHGQPVTWAACPTLELHIAFLKHCIETAHIPYVEIPPRPYGADFACCLTHDIDFFGIRRHALDRTLGGFLARGTVGTIIDLVRGRRPFSEATRNLLAAVSLPLVLLGVHRDPWQPLDDYNRADRGLPSTFFIVPFKNHAGIDPDGRIQAARAVKYGALDIQDEIRRTKVPGREIGLHGLDAWRDAIAGRAEMREVTSVTGDGTTGVRMHWLYFSEASPRQIEDAGFAYDSTYGYNNAVGYRSGTMQAFRLPGCETLLELPLAVMDTAMFYPDHMDLNREEALQRCRKVLDHASTFGGAVVVNWHDRSLAPERQWHAAYEQLLDELQAKNVWFATAADAVAWFRWRRAIRFTATSEAGHALVEGPPPPVGTPGARLMIHHGADDRGAADERVEESRFDGSPVQLTF